MDNKRNQFRFFAYTAALTLAAVVFYTHAVIQRYTSTSEIIHEIITYSTTINSSENTNKKSALTTFTSGTGFFVDNNHIVTNEHVVKGCDHIRIRGEIEPSYAKLYATDAESDLALLRTNRSPKYAAELRTKKSVDVGELVSVIGYPLEHGISGKYMVKTANITNIKDTFGNVNRLQFTDSVEKGNSGGPLLDSSGSVIGVVVGKMNFYLANADQNDLKPIKTASVAISNSTLETFLNKYNIRYATNNQAQAFNPGSTEQKAKEYIVNIHCVKAPVADARSDAPVFPSKQVAIVK